MSRLLGSLAALVLVPALTIPVSANAKNNTAGPTPANQATIATIHALHQTNELLSQADADYDGHRMKAMGHVHAAVKALRSTLPKGSGKGTGAKGAGKAAKNAAKGTKPNANHQSLPQAQSDALLQQALKNLQALQSQVGSGSGASSAQQAAATQISNAIQELNTALKIK